MDVGGQINGSNLPAWFPTFPMNTPQWALVLFIFALIVLGGVLLLKRWAKAKRLALAA